MLFSFSYNDNNVIKIQLFICNSFISQLSFFKLPEFETKKQ